MRVFEHAAYPTDGSSLVVGKKQGILLIQPFSAKICLENIREYSGLRPNSLLESAGKFLPRAGNYF